VSLLSSIVGSGGNTDWIVGDNQVIFCEAGMQQELFIVDELPACTRSLTMERQKSNAP
jgi:hypothetical protein